MTRNRDEPEPYETGTGATYIRRSTDEQEDKHQRDDIERWLNRRDLSFKDLTIYADSESGAKERDQFLELIEDIEDDEYDYVVIWEISRIARHGLLAQRFFTACEEHEAIIYVSNGSVREVRPDGTGRMAADIVASVAAEERRRLIQRTKSGMRRAREEGKWLGQVPVGFKRDEEGYLKPNLDPEYEDGETGYFDVVTALEKIDSDKWSYYRAEQNTPNITRQTLKNIYTSERQDWYMNQEAEDDRVDVALEDVEA